MFALRDLKGPLAALIVGATTAGCHAPTPKAQPSAQGPPPLVEANEEDPTGTRVLTRGLFQPTRRPGGLSSQATAIEDNLGVR